MPASCTHAYFGNKVFELLDDEIKQRILPYKSHYMMGLYGPDPLFFYKAYKRNSINDYGDQIHSQEAYSFFERGRTIYQNSSNKDACLAYLCGFMNHFILDSEVHGYVNEAEKQYHVSHARIEADLDRAILVREGLKASSTSYTHFIFPITDVTDIMAEFLDVDKELMLTTVKHMKLFNNAFHCPNQVKAWFVRNILNALGLKGIFDMIITDEEDERCLIATPKLVHMFDNATHVAVKNIKDYYDLLETDLHLSDRLRKNFN